MWVWVWVCSSREQASSSMCSKLAKKIVELFQGTNCMLSTCNTRTKQIITFALNLLLHMVICTQSSTRSITAIYTLLDTMRHALAVSTMHCQASALCISQHMWTNVASGSAGVTADAWVRTSPRLHAQRGDLLARVVSACPINLPASRSPCTALQLQQ